MADPFVDGRRRSTRQSSDPKIMSRAASLFLVEAAIQIADGVQGAMPGAARAPSLTH